MTLPLTRSDVEHIRDQHTPAEGSAPAWCRPCQQLHPCALHQLAQAALTSPTYEEAAS